MLTNKEWEPIYLNYNTEEFSKNLLGYFLLIWVAEVEDMQIWVSACNI